MVKLDDNELTGVDENKDDISSDCKVLFAGVKSMKDSMKSSPKEKEKSDMKDNVKCYPKEKEKSVPNSKGDNS